MIGASASRLVHDDDDDRRWRQDPLRCLSGDVLHQAGRGGRLRPLCQSQWRTGARRSAYRAGANGRSHGGRLVPFQAGGDWDGKLVREPDVFVTAIGAGTTYPDYKPAPFIVSSEIDGVDMVTVVTEGIFSYCGVKVKIDTDRHLGPETATVRAQGEAIGHVTTRRIWLADAVARRRASSDRRLQEGGPRHLRRADGPLQLQAGRTHDRWRRHRRGAGRLSADRQRRCGRAHAGRLRLGHHRHVRQAMARQGR